MRVSAKDECHEQKLVEKDEARLVVSATSAAGKRCNMQLADDIPVIHTVVSPRPIEEYWWEHIEAFNCVVKERYHEQRCLLGT